MPLDPQASLIIEQAAAAALPPYPTLTPPEARRAMEQRAAGIEWGAQPLATVHDLQIPGPDGPLNARAYTPNGSSPFPLLLYFHGGGWVLGSVETHDNLCRALAISAGCVVVSLDYRRAPENKFPAAALDCFATLKWLSDNAAGMGGDPERIAIGGDSSGANLATVTCLMAREQAGPMPSFQLLFYPVTNFAFDTPSYLENGEGYMLSRDDMKWFWNHYLPSEAEGRNALASPLQAADLRGLPPTLVITAGYDPLRDEAEAYAARLKAADVPTTLTRYEGMIHGFLRWAPVLDDAQKAIDQAAEAIRSALVYK